MASRKSKWLSDEVILVLDLFMRAPRYSFGFQGSVQQHEIEEMSALLRAIPIEQHLASDPRFRSAGAVSRKIGNFAALDSPGAGLAHYSKMDKELFDYWVSRQGDLADAALAIRREIASGITIAHVPPGIAEAPEDGSRLANTFDGSATVVWSQRASSERSSTTANLRARSAVSTFTTRMATAAKDSSSATTPSRWPPSSPVRGPRNPIWLCSVQTATE